ncbi:hypothetical protein C8J56DRAFT_1046142 [Mycena floridula]|nr:hypothetical protein C8J56DRAFT_1046142 [Mycena floridula]
MSLPINFKSDFLTVNDADFSKTLDRWASNARQEAKIVAFVKNNDDVLLALNYAKENGLPVGGGHSFGGSSSVKGGLIVDLSRYIDGCRIDQPSSINTNLKKTLEVSTDTTAFPRDKVLPTVLFFVWYDDSSSGKNKELDRDTSKKISALLQQGQATSASTPLDGDAFAKDDAKVAAAFGSNYARLQALKKKYDPELGFNRWFPIIPA